MITDTFRAWLAEVKYLNYEFHVTQRDSCIYLQAKFLAPNEFDGQLQEQSTRQWLLHPNMTKSEVIQTAFKLVLASVEHEAREFFHYQGKPIFGPHYSVDVLALSDAYPGMALADQVEAERQRCYTLGVAAERERCAKLCEDISDDYQRREGHRFPELKSDAQTGADHCADAIRTALVKPTKEGG